MADPLPNAAAPGAGPAVAVHVQGVTKTFGKGESAVQALKGVQFDAREGELLAFAEAKRRLTKRGLLLANVFIRNDEDAAARKLDATMAEIFPTVRALDTPGEIDRNTVLAAGETSVTVPLQPPWLMLKPRTGAEDVRAELKRMRFIA